MQHAYAYNEKIYKNCKEKNIKISILFVKY